MTSPAPSPHARRPGRRHTQLIGLLAALKVRSRLTYVQLAARTAGLEDADAVPATTLKRALDPRAVPKEQVVTAFVRACGGAVEEERDVLKVWRAARAEDRGILAALRAPSVSATRTRADFRAALVAAYEGAGAPPLRVLQDRAGTGAVDGAVLLPLTTAWRITRREGQGPVNWTQCEAFLRGCGIHHRRIKGPWLDAWKRTRTLPRAELGPTAADVRRATRGRPGILARHDAARLAEGIRPVVEAIAADRARYDATRLAAGIMPVMEALVADPVVRNAPTAMAAGVQVFADAFAVMFRSASREAHRNGTTPPDWVTATNLISQGIDPARADVVVAPHVTDDGIGLIARTPGLRPTDFQIESRRQRPGPPPALPGAHTPEPPTPATAV
ncbi:XRE family transcriptional regulator [Streptomyces sp. Y7]|uniref:XRE family transcriptional regulator n=1 Tax=Streptomyces sp. Y7 TaxID=3342392 RepID=UPI003723FBB3